MRPKPPRPSANFYQLALCAALTLIAEVTPAEGGACQPDTEIARLVSMTGDVRINGLPPVGELPFVPMCAGDLVTVGANSRASVFLLEADTPLRLDEQTVARSRPRRHPIVVCSSWLVAPSTSSARCVGR